MLKLRFRVPKSPQPIVMDIEANESLMLLLFRLEALIPDSKAMELQLMSGVPPKVVPMEDSSIPIGQLFRNMDTINVQANAKAAESNIVRGTSSHGRYVPPMGDRSIMVRRTVPGDNSCLFHSMAYVFDNKTRCGNIPKIREDIAETVLANPKTFTASTLGRDPASYAQWIRQKDSWGGATEIQILTFVFQSEIFVLDLSSGSMLKFGDSEGYGVRVFVVFTGNHYDAVGAANAMAREMERDDQVVFNVRDDRALRGAMDMLKSK